MFFPIDENANRLSDHGPTGVVPGEVKTYHTHDHSLSSRDAADQCLAESDPVFRLANGHGRLEPV